MCVAMHPHNTQREVLDYDEHTTICVNGASHAYRDIGHCYI